MLIRANRKNLKREAKNLLANEWSEKTEKALIKECLTGFVRSTTPNGNPFGHISFDERSHLERIDDILHTYGVEGMILDEHGEDVSGSGCDSRIVHDIHYCNAGDTYALTILYYNHQLYIGDCGQIMEEIT